MKRLLLAAVGLAGSLFAIPTAVATATSLPAVSAVAPASGSPPKVVLVTAQAPALPRYTVVAGDTLWALGIKFGRTWPNLASYNHVPDPNLILVGQVLTIPPASYLGASGGGQSINLTQAKPAAGGVQPTTHYIPPAPAPVTRSYSYGAPGSYQACVATRESGNGSGSSNIYGFLQGTWSSLGLAGSPGGASRAQQDAAFQMLYARDGRAPWSPYDGC